MPGLHSVATGDAGWSDAPWEADLGSRSGCQRLTVPPTDITTTLQQPNILLLESISITYVLLGQMPPRVYI